MENLIYFIVSLIVIVIVCVVENYLAIKKNFFIASIIPIISALGLIFMFAQPYFSNNHVITAKGFPILLLFMTSIIIFIIRVLLKKIKLRKLVTKKA